MKNLTLDKSWSLCMEQWDDMIVEILAGSTKTVKELKAEWCKRRGFVGIIENCFFCEYSGGNCVRCPAAQIDHDFNCEETDYDFYFHPLKFHDELTRLYKIYLEQK